MSHTCATSVGGEQHIWHVERLWELASDLPQEAVPVQDLCPILEQTCRMTPDELTAMRIAHHMERVLEREPGCASGKLSR